MLQFEDLKTARLSQTFDKLELINSCRAVYAGVSWPGKRPGFAVVVAMDTAKHFDSWDICLLEEYESDRVRDLVRKCGALDFKYSPKRWIGDYKNEAADYFIREMCTEQKKQERKFNLAPTLMLDMEHLYQYILDELKRLMDEDRRQLFLKDSMIKNYLGIKPEEVAGLQLGDYPAIEALAFAVIEMRRDSAQIDLGLPVESDMAESYSIKTAF